MNSETEMRRMFWPRLLTALASTFGGLAILVQWRYYGLVVGNIPFVILTFFIAGAAWLGTGRQLLEDELARMVVESHAVGGDSPW